jgi:hypothetical protein
MVKYLAVFALFSWAAYQYNEWTDPEPSIEELFARVAISGANNLKIENHSRRCWIDALEFASRGGNSTRLRLNMGRC